MFAVSPLSLSRNINFLPVQDQPGAISLNDSVEKAADEVRDMAKVTSAYDSCACLALEVGRTQ